MSVIARSGPEGSDTSFGYIGIEEGLVYIQPWIQDRLFAQCRPQVSAIRRHANVVDAVARCDTDLIVAAHEFPALASLQDEAIATLPLRVNLVARFADREAREAEQYLRERRRHRARVKRLNYSFVVTRHRAELEFFYDSMYAPTMAARYGKRARSVTRGQAFSDIFDQGALLLTYANGTPVAGVAVKIDCQTGRCLARLAGWLNGEAEWQRKEALKSTYHFLLEWGQGEGFNEVDFMGCEPFLTKGTLQSKRRLGTRVIPAAGLPGRAHALVIVRRRDPRIATFLISNPVLLRTAGSSFAAGYFCDGRTGPSTSVPYRCAGISGMHIIDLDHVV